MAKAMPTPGPRSGWKKCNGGVLVHIEVLPDAPCYDDGHECFAKAVRVLEVVGAEYGESVFGYPQAIYRVGEIVEAHQWIEPEGRNRDSGGIYYFATREEAEAFWPHMRLVPIEPIVPETGAYRCWKALRDGVLAVVEIEPDSPRVSRGRECRAKRIRVLEIIGGEQGRSCYGDPSLVYRAGAVLDCPLWQNTPTNQTGGFYLYTTRAEAENFGLHAQNQLSGRDGACARVFARPPGP